MRPGCARGAVNHEENLSAEQSAAKTNARVSRPNGDSRRPQGAQAAAREGAKTADRVRPAEAARVSRLPSQSFPKRVRLRRRVEFLRLQHEGRRQHTGHFVVLKASAAKGWSRVGITVSSRVGNAVVRNRVKRLVREVARRLGQDSDPPMDVVVIAKSGAGQVRYAEVALELGRALRTTPG